MDEISKLLQNIHLQSLFNYEYLRRINKNNLVLPCLIGYRGVQDAAVHIDITQSIIILGVDPPSAKSLSPSQ